LVLSFIYQTIHPQSDTLKRNTIDSLLNKPKGILGQITQNLLADTIIEDEKNLQRNDQPFLKYEGRIIRNIIIQSIEFGKPIQDTAKKLVEKLARAANNVHYKTRAWVIHNNLFFHENEKISPYLLGNNERYLRDLPYFKDAKIVVRPVKGNADSADVIITTKDVLSIGGSMSLRNSKSAIIEIKEDNLLGWGDRLEGQALYDEKRRLPFGYGGAYIKRNIAGSFIDGSVGYLNFDKTFNTGKREEKVGFIEFVKPLVNPYMLWTYAFNAETHASDNMFLSDSIYASDVKYKYKLYDSWAGYNLSAKRIDNENEFKKLRFLLSTRIVDQKFLDRPNFYADKYYYAYADLFAVLGAVSVFQLNSYKTRFIYGFGRNEDLPEGLDASFTAGYTKKAERVRPYAAINFQRYFFTGDESYFNYSLSTGTYWYKKRFEDITLLGNIDFFSRLMHLGPKWLQRSFINASFGKQVNSLLDEPFFVESRYGLPEFKNNSTAGSMRATVKAESVFFSPWSVLYFRFAPFIFGSATAFKLRNDGSDTKLYTAIGGGIRTRNESLIFGTMELRAVYLPTPDLFNHRYIIQFNTNLRFKYTQNFIRRPEFVQVN
jgi:hypothetical protein